MEKVIEKWYVYDTEKEEIDFIFEPYSSEKDLRKSLRDTHQFTKANFKRLKPVKCFIHVIIPEPLSTYEFSPIEKARKAEELARNVKKAIGKRKDKNEQ